MTKNKNYPLFANWFSLTDWILDKTEKIPVKVRFSIANRMANYAIDNVELIIEAIYSKNKVQLLKKVNMNIEKLRVLFRICYNRRYISEKQYRYIAEKLNENGKMCGGWLKSLNYENL